MSEEALKIAYDVKDLFSGVSDSFGKSLSEDVIDEIISSLHSMTSIHEESSLLKSMLLERLQQSRELGDAAGSLELEQ